VPAEAKPPASTPDVRAERDLSSLRDAAGTTNLIWRSAKCSTSSCIEVAELADGVAIRSSTAGDAGTVLVVNRDEWLAFVTGIKNGEFD
jgi:hypothetical protein